MREDNWKAVDLERIYRRQLVRNAGKAGRWKYGPGHDMAAARSGLNGIALMGVRIPRSLRYMLDREVPARKRGKR